MHSHRCNIPARLHVITSLVLTASTQLLALLSSSITPVSPVRLWRPHSLLLCVEFTLKLFQTPTLSLHWPALTPKCPFGKAGPKPNPIIGVMKMFAITPCSCGVLVSNCNKRGCQLFSNMIYLVFVTDDARQALDKILCLFPFKSISEPLWPPGQCVALCANNALIFLWCHKRTPFKVNSQQGINYFRSLFTFADETFRRLPSLPQPEP